MAASRKRKGRPIGETLGGMIAGFDQQIFRTLPPPHELVQKGAPVRGTRARIAVTWRSSSRMTKLLLRLNPLAADRS